MSGINRTTHKGFGVAARNGFGFGKKSERKISEKFSSTVKISNKKDSIDDNSEQEDNEFSLPKMEEMPSMSNGISQTINNPLENIRTSFDVRNGRNSIKSLSRESFTGRISKRDSLLSKTLNSMNDLKLTSLKERRSMNRGLKFQGSSNQVRGNALSKMASAEPEVVIEKIDEHVAPDVENNRFQTLSIFSKMMAGILNKIEDDENLQLE